MTHQQALHYVISSCARRHNLQLPSDSEVVATKKDPVFVLFGGQTAERQVSLMSGTNVWLKLMQSNSYQPYPFFWDQNEMVWEVPYSYALNHTTEEVYENCIQADTHWQKANGLANAITTQLAISSPPVLHPSHYTLEAFATLAQAKGAFVFIGLHGGKGENGELQGFLETRGIAHNGSHANASSLCMDKFATGIAIKNLAHPDIFSLPQKQVDLTTLFNASASALHHFWQTLCTETASTVFIIKPNQDGCSAGIVRLQSEHDLSIYLKAIQSGAAYFPSHTFTNQPHIIELPEHLTTCLIEPFIAVDAIRIAHHELIHTPYEGWVELTIGVLEQKGNYHALNPSITIAEGAVLSLEEKFQGGTGVNLTPPPPEILNPDTVTHIKTLIALVAQALDIRNYARIDIFYNAQLRKLIVIEANTLPGLTPSTVIYHQALAENPPMTPTKFLEKLIIHASE
jgi:D-alanine-D-alanine ligase-like ATP-grasp enzyme